MADNRNKCECVNKSLWNLRNLMIQDFEQSRKTYKTSESAEFTADGQSVEVYRIYGDFGYGSYEVSSSFPALHNPFYYKDFYDLFSDSPEKYTVQIIDRASNWMELVTQGTHLVLTVRRNGLRGEIVAETDGTNISGDRNILQSAKIAICLR